MRGLARLLAGTVVLVLGACGDDGGGDSAEDVVDGSGSGEVTVTSHDTGTEAPAHWTYEGEEGPDHWADLDEAYATCESGMEQSPVDIVNAVPTDIADPVLAWQPADVEMINNGHTIQVNVPDGSTSTLAGTEYGLLQFHWHKPSETTITGDPFAMELHFVHADDEGNLAVLAVLIDEGGANALYDELWAAQPPVGETAALNDVNFSTLLPVDLTTTTFDGSLTTPPCTEGVAWNVLTAPTTMSAEQLDAFVHEGNARPVQPLNDRTLAADNS